MTRAFANSAEAYDSFLGRYSQPLASVFADAAGVGRGMRALDVGCGPGALTRVLVDRLGSRAVAACDPSPGSVAECAARHPGVDLRPGRAEELPFEDAAFDAVLAQLVLPFVGEPARAATELRRVVRPGGIVAACTWDVAEGMEMLRHFWDAALAVDPEAPDEARVLRFGRAGEIADLFASAGIEDLEETTLTVAATYGDFHELWEGFLEGVGPAGAYCVGVPHDTRTALRSAMYREVGSPTGPFTLGAAARCATGRAPAT